MPSTPSVLPSRSRFKLEGEERCHFLTMPDSLRQTEPEVKTELTGSQNTIKNCPSHIHRAKSRWVRSLARRRGEAHLAKDHLTGVTMKGKAALSHARRTLLTTRSLSSSPRTVRCQLSYHLSLSTRLEPFPMSLASVRALSPSCHTQGCVLAGSQLFT